MALGQLRSYDKRATSASGGFGADFGYGSMQGGDVDSTDRFQTPDRISIDLGPEIAPGGSIHRVQFLEFTSSMSSLVSLEHHDTHLLADGSDFSKHSKYGRAAALFGCSTVWDRRSMSHHLGVAWETMFALGSEGSDLPWMTSLPLGLYLIPPASLLDHPAAVIDIRRAG
jgi:hypothetical protein